MPRPHLVFEEFVGRGRPIKVETLASESGVSERTADAWRDENDKREPSFTDLQGIFESKNIPQAFKLALSYELYKRSPDVRPVACGESATDDAHPMSLSIDAADVVVEIQRFIEKAQCPRSPGGASFTNDEAAHGQTLRAQFDVIMERLWRAIDSRRLRSQAG